MNDINAILGIMASLENQISEFNDRLKKVESVNMVVATNDNKHAYTRGLSKWEREALILAKKEYRDLFTKRELMIGDHVGFTTHKRDIKAKIVKIETLGMATVSEGGKNYVIDLVRVRRVNGFYRIEDLLKSRKQAA